jgi:opacity protein-like surface antigen
MNLTGKILFAVSMVFMLCGSASARHFGPYIGAFVGGTALMNSENTDNLGSFGSRYNPAATGSAVLGWDLEPGNSLLGEGRVELEYTHRSNPLNQVRFVEGNFKGGGSVTADSVLLNLIGVYNDNTRFLPYAGVGLGAARIEAQDLTVAGFPFGKGSAVVFAYQVALGIDIPVTNWLNLDLGYRFFGSTKLKFTEVNGNSFEMDYLSHNAVVGLRFGF